MTISPGTRVGSYSVVELLGVGGMGEVYRAHDDKLNRDVALKVLPLAFADDADRIARFRREARLLAALNHPNIAAIYGLEEAGPMAAIVLELIDGETLEDRLRQRRRLPLPEVLKVAHQIADALEAAHRAGIIHRDLKPANIKLAGDDVVKVLDFGLGKSLDTDRAGRLVDATTLAGGATTAGVLLGSVADMSPALARAETVDKRGARSEEA